LAGKEAKRQGYQFDDILDFILYTLPISIIGARIYYVIFDWQNYQSNPIEIIAIWHGGLAIYGGLIAGFICALVFTKKRGIPLSLFLDILAPGVMVGQIFGRWGNFVNQEAHGGETTETFLRNTLHLPDFIVNGMQINGIYYQPTFLYESLWNLLGLVIILILRHKKALYKQGEIFNQYVIWYGLGRFFIESMRTDSLMLFGVIRVSQLLSLLLVLVGLVVFIYRRKQKRTVIDYWNN